MTDLSKRITASGATQSYHNSNPLPRTEYDLIRWHGHAALITALISALFGILVATKFNFPVAVLVREDVLKPLVAQGPMWPSWAINTGAIAERKDARIFAAALCSV